MFRVGTVVAADKCRFGLGYHTELSLTRPNSEHYCKNMSNGKRGSVPTQFDPQQSPRIDFLKPQAGRKTAWPDVGRGPVAFVCKNVHFG